MNSNPSDAPNAMSSRPKYSPPQDAPHDFGHIKISRKAFRSLPEGGDVFWNKPRTFSEWEAWEDMIATAAYAPHEWVLRSGEVVEIERGETRPLAVRFLAHRWRWSKNRVHRFLKAVSEMDRISVRQRTTDGDTYLVENYDRYQGEWDADGTQMGRRRDADGTKEKQVKQVNKRESKKAHALPESWEPTEAHRELATERGLDVECEAEKMHDWALDKGITSRDWDARFRNWLRKADPPKSALRVVKGGKASPADDRPWWEAEAERFGT